VLEAGVAGALGLAAGVLAAGAAAELASVLVELEGLAGAADSLPRLSVL